MNAESTISADSENDTVTPPRKRGLRTILMVAGPALVLAGAGWFYLTGGRYESTDNASLQTGMVAISPSVPGTVVSVEVRENQTVKKGDVLFRIKADSYEAAVAEAEAELANARTDVSSMQADYREALSQVSAAKARYELATSEAARQKSLVAEGISSQAQYDEAVTEARTARDSIAASEAKADSLRAALSGAVQGPIDSQPDVRKAASKVTQARISLSDTIVRAPQDGVVTRVNQLQPGNYVTPGRPVFMLTGLHYWVQANFKENQLRYMRVGQPAEIEVDAFPDHALKGHVESFSPGTGSSFSVLPAENATGNWVKVVQRLPVQIAIDEAPADLPLSAGLSAGVEVDTGHKRHIFGPDTPPSTPSRAK
ncbi:HlyD family secretion protein [Novosphingobium mangrovi (ex Huang et al. 2023)]|uniref:HlyD family secretion protein n=1 Tax=Novosphingobium mangrovi (ex Huang et al. 2023) TaxID=2976432 RepID=A0ABT2I574_9SPHN|nr:HlyD family secretion protein [Novosphingobium mangrovi (ex Huang et al. 2023)]MCT2399966.1 HlyD family secretion protein [Novosphingobium mangrovi (ex Huang et al. 2023)]